MKKLYNWCILKLGVIKFYLGISMYNTEMEILKAPNLDVNEKDKKIQRKSHRNETLEKFYQGQRDEKYTKDFYEVLKKGDEYLRNADARKMDLTADKWGMSYNRVDPVTGYKSRFEHLGYFDEKHKNYGKTIAEVLNTEIDERSIGDDYEVKYMFDNTPIQLTFDDTLKNFNDKKGVKSNKRSISVGREEGQEVLNKIEDITDYIHVKKIGFEHRYFEFFIPKKYKVQELEENSDIFKELLNIETFWYTDKYGDQYGFRVDKYVNMIDFNSEFIVLKFSGIEIEIVGKL